MNIEPHKHKALIDIWSAAPDCWSVYCKGKNNDWQKQEGYVFWFASSEYRLVPSPLHPSYEQWKTYTANPEWWKVTASIGHSSSIVLRPDWHVDIQYTLSKSPQHPDNIKPKKKLIDWSKMPRGTMTDCGELLHIKENVAYTDFYSTSAPEKTVCMRHTRFAFLRLVEQKKFTYWGGGECPVPEGVVVEVVLREARLARGRCHAAFFNSQWLHDHAMKDIIAYRITSLAEGWTDNPREDV